MSDMTSDGAPRSSRPISWVRAARSDFTDFPAEVRDRLLAALTIVAEGRMPDIAKPLRGLGSGVFQLALRYRGDAFRLVYAVQLGADVWVVHAFRKKSKTGISTPKAEIDLIRQRLYRLREMLR